nr:MAG TPA: hypothetical protein [Caudoviricetes sp.]
MTCVSVCKNMPGGPPPKGRLYSERVKPLGGRGASIYINIYLKS